MDTNAKDIMLSPEAAAQLDKLLAAGAFTDMRLASLAERWRLMAISNRARADEVADKGDRAEAVRLLAIATAQSSCASDAEDQLLAVVCEPVHPHHSGMRRALDIARGCTDYGGGYSGKEYEAFQHGIATVATVLERALSGDDDMQLRVVEETGRAHIDKERG